MKTRETEDEQLCNAVYIYNIYMTPKPLDINKKSNTVETTALHNKMKSSLTVW